MAIAIGRFSVKNPVFVNILMIAVLILGTFSLLRLPQEQYSEVPFFWVNITVPYPGVSPADIEKTVTIKIENELQGLDRLKQVSSVTGEGLCVIRVEFDDGISNDEFTRLFQETRTRLSNVVLPEGVLDPVLDDFSSTDFLPVIEVVLAGNTDYRVLNKNALLLRDHLLKINQVSRVVLVGSRERRILIEADRRRLEAFGISIDQIAQAVRQQNLTIPGGTLETESREYILRTTGELGDYYDLNKIIVRKGTAVPGDEVDSVYVRDIAEISEEYDPKGIRGRFNGVESISLRVAKVAKGNSIRIIEDVKGVLDEYIRILPSGIEASLRNDSTVQIRDSIDVLISNAVIGLIILTVILFIFLGFRNAVMTALGIPITFAITFIILDALGETFNSNTLFAMVLVLGLIVDDAIVITENSFRFMQEGMNRRQAAIEGINQVAVPVTAATLTTIAAFLPLMILPGTIGKFLRIIPLTVTVTLLASTFEAVVFLPSHFADWPGGKRRRMTDFFIPLKSGFKKMLSGMYRYKSIVVIGFFILMAAAFALVPTIRQDLFSAEDYTYFYIDITLPPGSNIVKTDRVARAFEKRIIPLIGNGEIVSVSASVGLSAGADQNTFQNNTAQIVCDLTEKNEGRTRSIPEIMAQVQELCLDIPGVERVAYRKVQTGPPVAAPVSFRLFGDNYAQLAEVSESVKLKLSEYPELFDIKDNLDIGTPELRITVNREQAARLGLSVFAVGSFIQSTFDGIRASTFFKDNEEIDIIVKYKSIDEHSIQRLSQIKIPTPDGRLVPFSSVCNIDEGDLVASIKRVDGKREITIESKAYDEGNIKKINIDVVSMFNERFRSRFPGIELVVGGEFAELNDLLVQILRIFLIGVLLIYIILSTQFKSYTQPMLIMLAVPFAFVGVIIFLIVSRTPFSTTVMYAGVALAGIAVNDSIVLISFINELKKSGMSVREAVVEAASSRLRPIILTSLTTMGGLLPTAMGIGGKSVVWGPMASTIIFGLFLSTLSTLVFIPYLYSLLFDRKTRRP